jgi:hypothetical protein
MPLIRIDALKGRSSEEIKTLLDAVHRAVLSTFHVPQRDRYQIYHEHPASQSRRPRHRPRHRTFLQSRPHLSFQQAAQPRSETSSLCRVVQKKAAPSRRLT